MTDKTGKKLAFEIILNDAGFERMALPFKQNLDRIGVDMNVRTIDTSQYRRRTDSFDFDMVIDLWGQALSPGNEQRELWGSKVADTPGSRNTMGLKDPAIDHLADLGAAQRGERRGCVAHGGGAGRVLYRSPGPSRRHLALVQRGPGRPGACLGGGRRAAHPHPGPGGGAILRARRTGHRIADR